MEEVRRCNTSEQVYVEGSEQYHTNYCSEFVVQRSFS